jgi:uncharacterized membrane protein
MKISSPFTANDWSIRSFLLAVALLQFSVLVLIAFDALGFQVPVLQQLFTFIYLVFVPGFLLLRTFRIHKLGSVETPLYAAGLSIATLMFIGFLINTVFPVLGFDAPISLLPVTVALAVFVIVFSTLSYVRDKNFSDTEKWDCAQILSAPYLFFILLPFVSIIGAYVMNAFSINLVLVLLLLAIACAFIVLISTRIIPTQVYPLAVFSISLSLLLHWSLISTFLTGYDVLVEYFSAQLVVQNAVWDPSIPGAYNGVLSVVMLAPFFSLLCNLSLVSVFKIVYPTLYALVPVALFWLYKKQTDDKIALVAVAFIISLVSFYIVMPMVARQEIAEIFVVLSLLLVVDRKIETKIKSGLFVIFLAALAVSHYALSFIFILCLVAALLTLSLQEKGALRKSKAKLMSLFSIEDQAGGSVQEHITVRESLVTVSLSLIFIFCVLVWYTYAAAGTEIKNLADLSQNMVASIHDILNPSTSQGAAILFNEPLSSLHALTKYLYIVSLGVIVIGLLATWIRPAVRLNREISAFYPAVCVLLAAGILVPYVAGSISTDRLLHFGLLFVAPLFALGALAVGDIASAARVRRRTTSEKTRTWVLGALSVFLALFLLLNSGLIYEVAHDNPTSIALSKTAAYPVFNKMETTASLWLQKEISPDARIYADAYHYSLISSVRSQRNVRQLWGSSADFQSKLLHDNYIFFGTTNVANKELYMAQYSANNIAQYVKVNASEISLNRSLLYDNGGTHVLLT